MGHVYLAPAYILRVAGLQHVAGLEAGDVHSESAGTVIAVEGRETGFHGGDLEYGFGDDRLWLIVLGEGGNES